MRCGAVVIAALAWSGLLQGQECKRGEALGAVVNGVVVDRETRVPLQGATVHLSWSDRNERTYQTETDSTGRFRLCRVRPDVLLDLRAEFWDKGPLERVRVAPGDSIQVRLEVEAPASAVRGTVRQSGNGQPIADAVIRVLNTPLEVVSDSRGAFVIPKIPPGRYQLHIEHLGYGARTDSVLVDFRSTVQLTAELSVQPIALPPLVVSTQSHILADVGFYDRQRVGTGRFLTKDMWRDQGPLLPSDVLRNVAGVKVQLAANMMDHVVYDRNNCPMRYFMDGARLNPTFQIDQIDVQWIEALEVYRGPSEVPGEFSGFSSSERGNCGVIVIWTRGASHR